MGVGSRNKELWCNVSNFVHMLFNKTLPIHVDWRNCKTRSGNWVKKIIGHYASDANDKASNEGHTRNVSLDLRKFSTPGSGSLIFSHLCLCCKCPGGTKQMGEH